MMQGLGRNGWRRLRRLVVSVEGHCELSSEDDEHSDYWADAIHI